ncbi:hypothetical protein DOTSEDRAFT_130106, partial [Dothistroma septosporum NZE10]
DAAARAWASPQCTQHRYFDVYAASKAPPEHAPWKALRESGAELVVNTVAQDSNSGPCLVPSHRSKTCKIIHDARKHSNGSGLRPFTNDGYRWLVDVRDTASLRVVGLLDSILENMRLLGHAHECSGHQLVRLFMQHGQKNSLGREVKPDLPGGWLCIDAGDTSRSLHRLGKQSWVTKDYTLGRNLLDSRRRTNLDHSKAGS